MSERKYYSKKETAEILGVNPKTIERYLLTGRMKGARLEKAWKISSDDIHDFYEMVKKETAEKLKQKQEGVIE